MTYALNHNISLGVRKFENTTHEYIILTNHIWQLSSLYENKYSKNDHKYVNLVLINHTNVLTLYKVKILRSHISNLRWWHTITLMNNQFNLYQAYNKSLETNETLSIDIQTITSKQIQHSIFIKRNYSCIKLFVTFTILDTSSRPSHSRSVFFGSGSV